ncbi:hypothetical protein Curi_c15990 [Gottschalkia acidurici 9a]|uniref:Uncharacterized protein n=1 Tax=Gottschalkia acidurici (strain ATCC 7906 / DSM 604 / BCRC 14475 / CIP 104303 / KCTC 5404 / NCIMB 10678 / 9a) TaxID=1128398 RepID=K0B0L2_GOTA9|nr:hypothetical protein [Gottschalkia acidurici]AFS78607.1 hypothetical protein Curi_c15990 [Gottschalkia acidurici 9a]
MPINDEINEKEEVRKKGSAKKTLLIIFVVIPLSIMTLLYLVSDSFKESANKILRKIPVVKSVIGSYPTKAELVDRELSIAKYYIEELDKKSAADKLYIVKKEDEKLYNTLVKRMNKLSSKKTEEILKEVRNLELRKDLLSNLYEEVESDKTLQIRELTSKLEGMKTRVAVEEINRGDIVTEEEFIEALSYMNDSAAVNILYYLDGGSRSNILFKLSSENMSRKNQLQNLLNEKRAEEEELNFMGQKLAQVYSVKDPKDSIKEIGNTDKYSIKALSRIYMNLSPQKSAEVLVNSKDPEFIEELFSTIKEEEELVGVQESSVVEISSIMTFLKEYNKKVDDLVVVYDKMAPSEAARAIEKLLENKQEITVFTIKEHPGYKLSDYKVAVEIMKRLKKPKLAKIFSNLTPEKTAQITKILAIE